MKKILLLLLLTTGLNAQITLNIDGDTYTVTGTEMINSMNAFAMGVESCVGSNPMTLRLATPTTTRWDWGQTSCRTSVGCRSVNSADPRWYMIITGSSNVPFRTARLYFNDQQIGSTFNSGSFLSNFQGVAAHARYEVVRIQLNETLINTGFSIPSVPTLFPREGNCSYYSQCSIVYNATKSGEDLTLSIIKGTNWSIRVLDGSDIVVSYEASTDSAFETQLTTAINYINNN